MKGIDLATRRTALPDVMIIVPERHDDPRGTLAEVWRRDALEAAGIGREFVQENHSVSNKVGTIRGLHYQVAPAQQAKLVRVIRGRALDVAVDLRRGSATYGQHAAVELSADAWSQLYVPEGFAHGFCTLEPETHVIYKLTEYYAPEHERGLHWADPALGIDWPVSRKNATVSEKDRALPRLAQIEATA